MQTYRQITDQQQSLIDLQGLMEVYEEIAAMKMQRIRQAIVDARDYFTALAKFSDEVGADLQNLKNQNKHGEAVLFVAANANLFGEIIHLVFADFLKYIEANPGVKIYVAGNVGVNLMQYYADKFSFEELVISDEEISSEVLTEIVAKLSKHQKIHLFYGQFYNIVLQEARLRSLSGEILAGSAEEIHGQDDLHLNYLYEPSPQTISSKIGTEIFASVCEQTLNEAQLAKFASRLMHLDRALSKTNEMKINLLREKRNLDRKMNDKKQRSRFLATRCC